MNKPTNPKAAFGDKKPPLSLVPMPVLYEVALGMLEGHMKGYRSHNFRVAGCRSSTYFNAVMRHLTAWWEGEDNDPESNLPHLVKAICCLVIMRDAEHLGVVTDDRPPKHPDGWQDTMKAHVAWLRKKYPQPVEPYTQKGEEKSDQLRKPTHEESSICTASDCPVCHPFLS